MLIKIAAAAGIMYYASYSKCRSAFSYNSKGLIPPKFKKSDL